jgi:hypothetical protein
MLIPLKMGFLSGLSLYSTWHLEGCSVIKMPSETYFEIDCSVKKAGSIERLPQSLLYCPLSISDSPPDHGIKLISLYLE